MLLMLLSGLMLLCQVQTEGNQNEDTFPFYCPPGSEAWNSDCYVMNITPKSWYDAELACEKWPSGHLVSIVNATEAFYVSSLVKNHVGSYQYVWIGLHDPTVGQEPRGGGWQWINSDELHYTNWEINPFNVGDQGYCGVLTQSSGYLKYRDYQCEVELPFVCKLKD